MQKTRAQQIVEENRLKAIVIAKFRGNEYAYKTIEEYEEITGFKVNEAFSIGWSMARCKNKHLGIY